MESSAAIRSFHYPMGTMSHMRPSFDKQVVVPIHNVRWNSKSRLFIQHLAYDRKHINSHMKGSTTLVSCAKTAEPINTSNSDDASPGSTPQGSLEKKPLQAATFPNGFEDLVLEVCDETEIAELKVKAGDFEMHIKRNIGATTVPLSNVSPTTPPPIPSKPMDSAPGTLPPSPPKSSPDKKNLIIDASRKKSPILTALEASGIGTYVLIPSPTVGFFRRGRTVKGKRQPPICKEGDLVEEGQVLGYLDQFGSGIPVKTDVAGQVLKLLVEDGEPVGYGDPVIAVLPLDIK